MKVRGYHELPCGSYDLIASPAGVISCGKCGARDLLPEQEALDKAGGTIEGLERFATRFYQQVRAGQRS